MSFDGKILTIVGLVLVLLILPLWGACGGDDDSTEPESVETEPTDKGTPAETEESEDSSNLPPKNPCLADSAYALAHGDSAQQDSTEIAGPVGPTQTLDPLQINYAPIGPAHFGLQISSPYPDGRRVIWSNGGDRIAKLDHDTFDVLATYELPDKKIWTYHEAEEAIDKFETLRGQEAFTHAIQVSAAALTDLSGVYALLDRDHNLYVGNPAAITVYTDEIAGDPDSEIAVKQVWPLPEEVTGLLIGMNMTYDGRLILVTEHGYVMAVSRDFSEYDVIKLRHSEGAKEYTEAMFEAHGKGYGWVRNSYAIDDQGGIYIVSAEHLHKIIWTGDEFSIDESDGAWSEPLINEIGIGSGSGVSLMGFGDEDQFVVITDGAKVMNLLLFWREDIPDDWERLPGMSSRRIAGMQPVNMGDPDLAEVQSEQSVVVAGYGAVMVNNAPASIPEWFTADGGQATMLLVGYLGTDPAYTPYGVQKFTWDSEARELKEAWVNSEVSCGNGVPYVSYSSNMMYLVGVRDGKWTLEALDWTSGKSAFHWVVGGERYNSFYSGVQIDHDGRIIYGTSFGKVRLENIPTRTELPTPPPIPTVIPESTDESIPAAQGPRWTYNVTYAGETAIWTEQVSREEPIDGVDTYVIETFYSDTPLRRVYAAQLNGYADLKLVNQTTWRSKQELEPVLKEQDTKAMGVLDVTATITNTYDGTFGAALSEGKVWTYEQNSVATMGDPRSSSWTAEVTGIEEITVPTGTFNCHKVEHVAEDMTRTEWWDIDGEFLVPVKVISEGNYEFVETQELTSYTYED